MNDELFIEVVCDCVKFCLYALITPSTEIFILKKMKGNILYIFFYFWMIGYIIE